MQMDYERIVAALEHIDPAFLNTPQFESMPLSEELGVRLILKVETVNPIRSFKGRGASLFFSQLSPDVGQIVCASAGNFGQGLAYCARKRPDLRLIVFAAENANDYKISQMRKFGAEVRLGGSDFDAAKERARAFSQESGVMFVEDGDEPTIAEGAATIGVELLRWPTALDCIVVPLGNGALLAGVGAYVKNCSPGTRVIGVCAEGAPAMALSLSAGKEHRTQSASTIADGIAVRIPVPRALRALESVVDEVLLVDDALLIHAMRLVFKHHGILTEPAGVAGLGAVLKYRERFRGAAVAIPLCGANLTPDQINNWIIGFETESSVQVPGIGCLH